MTDLVQKLVGALKHCEGVFMSHEINHINGGKIEDDALTIIRAALSAAKDGGWVAVPVEPYGYLYDVHFEDEDGDPAGSKIDNFTRSLKYAKDSGTNVRAVCILPNPPKGEV